MYIRTYIWSEHNTRMVTDCAHCIAQSLARLLLRFLAYFPSAYDLEDCRQTTDLYVSINSILRIYTYTYCADIFAAVGSINLIEDLLASTLIPTSTLIHTDIINNYIDEGMHKVKSLSWKCWCENSIWICVWIFCKALRALCEIDIIAYTVKTNYIHKGQCTWTLNRRAQIIEFTNLGVKKRKNC